MRDEIETIQRAALEGALRKHSDTVGSAFVSAFGALPATAIVANRAIGLDYAPPKPS